LVSRLTGAVTWRIAPRFASARVVDCSASIITHTNITIAAAGVVAGSRHTAPRSASIVLANIACSAVVVVTTPRSASVSAIVANIACSAVVGTAPRPTSAVYANIVLSTGVAAVSMDLTPRSASVGVLVANIVVSTGSTTPRLANAQAFALRFCRRHTNIIVRTGAVVIQTAAHFADISIAIARGAGALVTLGHLLARLHPHLHTLAQAALARTFANQVALSTVAFFAAAHFAGTFHADITYAAAALGALGERLRGRLLEVNTPPTTCAPHSQ